MAAPNFAANLVVKKLTLPEEQSSIDNNSMHINARSII